MSGSKRFSLSQELTPTLTLGLSLGVGLGLAWGHFQNKYFFVFTSFKDFSLNVYDDTNLLHLVSGSERLSFSQELTPTLTLGLSLGLGLGFNRNPNPRINLRVRVRVSFRSLPG